MKEIMKEFSIAKAAKRIAKKITDSRKRLPIRIVFKDRDGSLIMNREGDATWFIDSEEFLNISLTADARERGVRIISSNYVYKYRYLVTPKVGGSIECVVEYLSKK